MPRHLTRRFIKHSWCRNQAAEVQNMIMTVRDEDKPEAVEIGRRFEKIGYRIFATKSTAEALNAAGVKAIPVRKIEQESPNLLDLILGHEIDLVIDIPAQGAEHSRDGLSSEETLLRQVSMY